VGLATTELQRPRYQIVFVSKELGGACVVACLKSETAPGFAQSQGIGQIERDHFGIDFVKSV
jgi:hypothetical protein